MNTILTSEYRKVIPARFTTKRDGTPLHCFTCGAQLVAGQASAATPDFVEWLNYCATCSTSRKAQVAGLLARVEALVEPLGDAVPADVLALVTTAEPLVEAALTVPTDQDCAQDVYIAAKGALLAVRASVNQARKAVRDANAFDASTVPAGHHTIDGVTIKVDKPQSGKWAGFVFVKDEYGDRLGMQKPGQGYRGKGEDILRAIVAQAQPLVQTAVPQGYYATVSRTGNNDLDFWFVRVDADGQTNVKRVIGGHADTAVRRSEAEQALAAIEAGGWETCGLRFAYELKHCYKCNRHLTDQESRDRGMGADCYYG